MSRPNAPDLLKEMKDILGDKMILAYGTVLWLYRDGHLHEDKTDDEDTFMLAENLNGDVINRLKQNGFAIYGTYPMASGKIGEISFTKDGVKIDIYVAHKQGDYRYWAMWGEGTHYYAKLPREFLEDPDKYEWNGEVWQIPQNIEGYLTATYGDWEDHVSGFDWRIDHVCYDPHFKENE